jgi:hypothetical protein
MPRKKEQPRISYNDVPQFIKELHKKNGISKEAFLYRINKAKPRLDMYVAATKPLQKVHGTSRYVKYLKIADEKGIPRSLFYNRIGKGWEPIHACSLPVDRHRIFTDEEIQQLKAEGKSVERIRKRITDGGWDKKRAMTAPIDARKGRENPWLSVAISNGICKSTFYQRKSKYKWTEEEAATIPIGGTRALTVEQNKQFLALGLDQNTVRNRIKHHKWSVEKAVSTPYMSVEGVK